MIEAKKRMKFTEVNDYLNDMDEFYQSEDIVDMIENYISAKVTWLAAVMASIEPKDLYDNGDVQMGLMSGIIEETLGFDATDTIRRCQINYFNNKDIQEVVDAAIKAYDEYIEEAKMTHEVASA